MLRHMLLVLMALGGLILTVQAQPPDEKKDDKAEQFPAPLLFR